MEIKSNSKSVLFISQEIALQSNEVTTLDIQDLDSRSLKNLRYLINIGSVEVTLEDKKEINQAIYEADGKLGTGGEPSTPVEQKVVSVNGKEGKVVLTAEDVKAEAKGVTKSLVDAITSDKVKEKTNLYFTEARVESAASVVALKSQLASLNNEVGNLSETITTLTSRIKALETKAEAADATITTLRSDVDALKSKE